MASNKNYKNNKNNKNQNNKKNQKSSKNSKTLTIAILAVVLVVVVAIAVWMIYEKSGEQNSSGNLSENQNQIAENQNQIAENLEPAPVDLGFLKGIDTSNSKDIEFIMTDGNRFVMTVLPKVAPKTVENFLGLVSDGFYDGIIFHRVIPGFMAQGGDPEGTGMGGSGKPIEGEFASNGFENPLVHNRGVVSMARTNNPNSASSQFFICYEDTPDLNGEYAAFGYISEGMEVIDSFYSEGTDSNDRPLKEVKIKTAKILE